MFQTTNFYLDIYLYLVLLIKISYIIITIVYLRSKYKKYEFTDKIKYVKNILHSIFNFLLILLIIFLFNPFFKHRIELNDHIKLFLFAFGVMSLITQIQSTITN